MFLVCDCWSYIISECETLEAAVKVMETWHNIASSGFIETPNGDILTLEEAKQAIIDREAFLNF
jgi:hypothetical protein